MYSRMVVPLDWSSLSEQVLPYVRQLGLGLSIPVTLMTVVEPPTPTIGHRRWSCLWTGPPWRIR